MPEARYGLKRKKVRVRPSISHYLLTVLCSFVVWADASGQNVRCQTVPAGQQTLVLDSGLLEPGSIILRPSVPFTYDLTTHAVKISDATPIPVQICYRLLPERLTEPLQVRDLSLYDQSRERQTRIQDSIQLPQPLIRFGDRIQAAGSISRGLTFGNRQDVFVNSALNLRLAGALNDNLFIEAVITDQNIPYQPEGNTQQIRDFDNVYIKIFNDDFNLTAGDIVLSNPWQEGYFLRYYKNVLGLQFNYRTDTSKKWVSRSHLAGAASKGKFASIQLEPIEGAQGPYRLTGPNGERFIIVLANSERVFIDGERLTRGFDQDYVIDYNLGEITFNANVLITPFTRIRVDFEYAEQFYSRSNLSLGQALESDRLSVRINYYGESDNPNSTLGFQPSIDDLNFLNSIGDNVDQAGITGADSVGFSATQNRYAQIDTVDLDGNGQRVFVLSTDPDRGIFSVVFTEVGFGNGDYLLLSNTTNGPTFEWVSPQGGVSQGNYAPQRTIPLPISKRMWSAGATYRLSEHEEVTQEVAVSSVDLNRFSELDDGDNQDLAWMGSVRSTGRSLGTKYELSTEIRWELDQPDFRPIDRYRYIEFDRDWDYAPNDSSRQDFILWGRVAAFQSPEQRLEYEAVRRVRGAEINGWQQRAKINQRVGRWLYTSDHFLLDNRQGLIRSTWRQTFHDVSYRGRVVPGYRFRLDHQVSNLSDSVLSSRMYYRAHEFYLTNSDSTNMRYRLSYEKRYDRRPREGSLLRFQEADNYGAEWSTRVAGQQIRLDGRYRFVRVDSTNDREEWLNARLTTNGSFLKRIFSHQLTYQTGNVRVLERQFVFVEVGGNQGTHAWRDENNDGIRDLNEFYEAINPDEAQFAKIFLPTDTYISAFETRYQQSLSFQFPIKWRQSNDFLRFVSRWTGRWTVDRQYRTTETSGRRFNPFKLNLNEENVLFAQSRWQYGLDYNLTGNGLGWSGSIQAFERKDLLANGFEFSTRDRYESYVRWRFGPDWEAGFQNGQSTWINQSDFLDNRNADILDIHWGPIVNWRPSRRFRLETSYKQSDRRNRNFEVMQEFATVQEASLEANWRPEGGRFNAGVDWLNIDYEGELNTFVAYRLLDALEPGQNYRWRLNWQQEIAQGLRLTVQYNGRKSAARPPVHTGTMVLTAFF